MVSRNLCDNFLVSTKYKIGTCTHLLKRVTKVKKVKSCVRLGQDGGDECKLKQITGIIIKKKKPKPQANNLKCLTNKICDK